MFTLKNLDFKKGINLFSNPPFVLWYVCDLIIKIEIKSYNYGLTCLPNHQQLHQINLEIQLMQERLD